MPDYTITIPTFSQVRAVMARALGRGPRNTTESTTGAVPEGTITAFGQAPSHTRTRVTTRPLYRLREPTPRERLDAVAASRFLRARLGLCKALFENSARHALGTGLVPNAISEDRDWNERADEYFDALASRPEFDVRREHDFYSMQGVILPDMMCDGDCGAAKVRDEEGAPQVQLFPTEAIADASALGRAGDDRYWLDGILRDDSGRPVRYRIVREVRPGEARGTPVYEDYEAADFLHIGRFDRININRPIPWLHHGDGACTDILDLVSLEKAAAKVNSYFAAAITTATGEAPLGFEAALTRETTSAVTQDTTGATTTTEQQRHYVNLDGGGAIPVLAEGEKFEAFRTDRPSVTFSGFIDWLVNDIAWGFGVPPQFVWAVVGMTGPNARMVLQQVDWFFHHLQDLLIRRFCRPVWESVIEDAMATDRLSLPAAGANWRRVQWQGPASMTIDRGRDGKLFESLVKSGMMSRAEWHEMAGKHGRRQRHKIIDEIAEDIAYCQERKIPMELYFGVKPGDILGTETESLAVLSGETDPEQMAETIVDALESRKIRAA